MSKSIVIAMALSVLSACEQLVKDGAKVVDDSKASASSDLSTKDMTGKCGHLKYKNMLDVYDEGDGCKFRRSACPKQWWYVETVKHYTSSTHTIQVSNVGSDLEAVFWETQGCPQAGTYSCAYYASDSAAGVTFLELNCNIAGLNPRQIEVQ